MNESMRATCIRASLVVALAAVAIVETARGALPFAAPSPLVWCMANSGVYTGSAGTSQLTASNGTVSLWTDYGSHASGGTSALSFSQTTASIQPTYKVNQYANGTLPCIHFSTTSSLANSFSSLTGGSLAQPNTVIFVGNMPLVTGVVQYFFDGIDSANRQLFSTNSTPSGQMTIGAGANVVPYIGTYGVFSLTFSGANSSVYWNGWPYVSGNLSTHGVAGYTLGAAYTQAGNSCLTGDICEFLVFSSALSSAQRQSVEAYLCGKWFGNPATDPGVANVISPTTYSVTGLTQTGTYTAPATANVYGTYGPSLTTTGTITGSYSGGTAYNVTVSGGTSVTYFSGTSGTATTWSPYAGLTATGSDVWTGKTYAGSSGTANDASLSAPTAYYGTLHGVAGTITGAYANGGTLSLAGSNVIAPATYASGTGTASGLWNTVDQSHVLTSGTYGLLSGATSGTATYPASGYVLSTAGSYGIGGTSNFGTLTLLSASPSDVWTGVTVQSGTGTVMGNLTLSPSLVLTTGTIHGSAGTYNAGNLSLSGSNVLAGVAFAYSSTGTLSSGGTLSTAYILYPQVLAGSGTGTYHAPPASAYYGSYGVSGSVVGTILGSYSGGTAFTIDPKKVLTGYLVPSGTGSTTGTFLPPHRTNQIPIRPRPSKPDTVPQFAWLRGDEWRMPA